MTRESDESSFPGTAGFLADQNLKIFRGVLHTVSFTNPAPWYNLTSPQRPPWEQKKEWTMYGPSAINGER